MLNGFIMIYQYLMNMIHHDILLGTWYYDDMHHDIHHDIQHDILLLSITQWYFGNLSVAQPVS